MAVTGGAVSAQDSVRKPELNLFQIVNMSFGFFGIQIGFALQNGNVSRIFQTLGADMSTLPLLWLAGPITGLIMQPIVGYFSDKTWGPLGRRRPYFLIGAILTTLSFFTSGPALWLLTLAGVVISASAVPALAVYGPELFGTHDRGRANGTNSFGFSNSIWFSQLLSSGSVQTLIEIK